MFEAYSIGIRVRLVNLATQGLTLLGKDILKTHGQAVQLEKQLNALKLAGTGYAAMKIGDGMLGALTKTVQVSKEYTRQLSLMGAAGMSQKEIAEATAAAWKTSRDVQTSSAAENLAVIRELRSSFGLHHMDEAYSVLPMLMRTSAVIQAQTGKSDPHLPFEMVKTVELTSTGALTLEKLQRGLDMQAQALISSGGTLNANDFLMAAKYAKTSALTLSDEYKYMILPTLMQELKSKGGGAQSAGTITERLRTMIVGGQIPQQDIQNWIDAKLIRTDRVVPNKHGIGYKLLPGAIVGSDEPDFDLYHWAQRYGKEGVANLMRSKGLTEEQAITALSKQVNKNFGFSTFLMKSLQFDRDKELIQATPSSYKAYQSLMQTNPQLAEMAIQKQWENVQARIGFEVLPRLIPYMIKFANILDGVSQWMQKNGAMTTKLVFGLGTLGIGLDLLGRTLMAAGIIKFLGLGPMIGRFFGIIGTGLLWLGRVLLIAGRALLLNPIGLVLTGIAVAAYFLWKNWDEIGPKLTAAWETVRSSLGAVADWIVSKWKWVKSLLPFGGDDKESTSPATPGTQSGSGQTDTTVRYESRHIATRDQSQRPFKASLYLTESGRREIASSTSAIQAREVSRPLGSGMYDVGLGLPPVGMNYAK
ncbi:hypothetical protein [Pandoraea apista]|uniref:hypothetical protein n=1 Tax=Pandoraea apista TaxID=93218 RepID=UPI000B8BE374|nr:hypothetical protein [Pandoraea apista]OXS89547.1 hypothetical protein B7H01_19850 [Pandoraea apista]